MSVKFDSNKPIKASVPLSLKFDRPDDADAPPIEVLAKVMAYLDQQNQIKNMAVCVLS